MALTSAAKPVDQLAQVRDDMIGRGSRRRPDPPAAIDPDGCEPCAARTAHIGVRIVADVRDPRCFEAGGIGRLGSAPEFRAMTVPSF